MSSIVVSAMAEFVVFEIYRAFGFNAVHRRLSRTVVRPSRNSTQPPADDVVSTAARAVGLASALYLRKVHCLQRCFALTRLLRRRGVDARLIIGYQSAPLQYHAWVEVDGRLVSDPAKNQQFYIALDRL